MTVTPNVRLATATALSLCFLSALFFVVHLPSQATASAVAAGPPSFARGSRRGGGRLCSTTYGGSVETVAAKVDTTVVALPVLKDEAIVGGPEATNATASDADADEEGEAAPKSNPVVQLLTYVKVTAANFKDGLGKMNQDHKRCNGIRAKQKSHAAALGGGKVPRGAAGAQAGGITYEEYDFLKKGLVDRQKLLAVSVVALFLPNYFVYYLWSFPDMMPGPFLKPKVKGMMSRDRCHAVLTTLLELEKGARVAPWTTKLNPFGKGAADRNIIRLDHFGTVARDLFEAKGASGPKGGRVVLEYLKDELYTESTNEIRGGGDDGKKLKKPKETKDALRKRMLAPQILPKQIAKGLGKAVSADSLSKGASPFGIGLARHIEAVALADEFLADRTSGGGVSAIETSDLLEEACSARLIGGPDWDDAERREALEEWLKLTVEEPRKVITGEEGTTSGAGTGNTRHFHGTLARAALMGYHVVDAARDARADSKLVGSMYRSQKA